MKKWLLALALGVLLVGGSGCETAEDESADTKKEDKKRDDDDDDDDRKSKRKEKSEETTEYNAFLEGEELEMPSKKHKVDKDKQAEAYEATLMEYEYGMPGEESVQYWVCKYYIYDIDEDGVSELLIHHGTCEADYTGEVYTFDGENAVYLGSFSTFHTSVYTAPGTNGFITQMGHMGEEQVTLISIEDNGLSETEILPLTDLNNSETGLPDWIEVADLYEGAEYLEYTDISEADLIRSML
jgi:hypothetical protein